MAQFINMVKYADGTNFLHKHMFSSSLSSDGRSMTIKWNCWPQEVKYEYSYRGKKYTGYYSGGSASAPGGIYREEDNYKKKHVRRSIFEGVKTYSIKYRKNGGTWTTIYPKNYNDHIKTFTSSKNGDKYEIKVTYYLCTMGFPHRNYPFMWFGYYGGVAKRYHYKNGDYKYFTDAKPFFPGTYYPCVPDIWQDNLVSYTWNEPEENKSWSKLYGSDSTNKDDAIWVESLKCEKNPHWKVSDSWTSEKDNAPQGSRRSSYFIYKREFTDTYITSGIIEKPPELIPPETPIIEVIPAHGEDGSINILYNHKSNIDGKIDLYGVQKIDGKLKSTQIIKDVDVICGDSIQISVDFIKSGFQRINEIRYYAVAKIYDSEYKTYRKKCSANIMSWDVYAKGHYFNEEPPAVSLTIEESSDTTKLARIKYNKKEDPDYKNTGDTTKYIAYIKSEYEENNTFEKQFWGGIVNNSKGVDGIHKYYTSMDPVTTSYIDIDMTPYQDREKITVWVESTDGYKNSYYYSSLPVTILKTKSPNASIKVEEAHGERGKASIIYNHDKGIPGSVQVMAFQSDDSNGRDGKFKTIIKTINFTKNEIGTYKDISIEFKNYFTRSRYIGYFVIATDEDGKKSYLETPTWDDCTMGHYFNEEPPPVTPTVNQDLLKSQEIAYLSWDNSIDPDGDETTYELFIKNEDDLREQEEFAGPGANGLLWYTQKIETKNTKYNFSISKYDGSKISVWIRTKDGYKNSYYYTGNILEFANEGLSPYKPLVTTVPAHEEYGDLYINYSHPTGRSGKVYLYAIGKYRDGRKILVNVFEKLNIVQDDYVILSNGVNQPYTIDFRKLFGNEKENRSCEIRYYAVAYTVGSGWEDNCSEAIGWTPSVDMFDKWITGHYYNEEPAAVIPIINEDKTDLHYNAYISWNKVEDPDGDIVKYYVYLNAKTDPNKKQDSFFLGDKKDQLLNYTHDYVTENNNLDINLDEFAEDEEFELWIKSDDGYPNSYYYSSEMLTFQKLSYHAPKVNVSIDNVHGEKGKLSITYIHPDIGQEDRDDFSGKVTVYAYVNDVYTKTIIEDEPFNHKTSKEFIINFADISLARSKYISYFVVAEDNVAGLLSSDTNCHFASASERIGASEDGPRHYYNEEPTRVFLNTGLPDKDEDRLYYMFDYINMTWDESIDPDNDDIFYNIYVNSIDENEPKHDLGEIEKGNLIDSSIFYRKFNFPTLDIVKDFNRYYQIRLNTVTDKYETYQYNFENNSYIKINESNSLGFKINYKDIDEGWPEADAWKNLDGTYKYGEIWVETTDGYKNSYYRCSNIYKFTRQKHEPPDKVIIQCATAHGETGKLTITYTHPEDLDGTIYLYGYQEGIYVKLIDTFEMKSGTTEEFTIDFREHFERSHNISYYAIAKDNLLGLGLISDNRDPSVIALEEQATGHYFNEEPPAVNVSLVEGYTPFKTVKIKWDLVDDPDGDDVNYYIYLRCSTSGLNKYKEYFYGNGKDVSINTDGSESENPSSIGEIEYYNIYKITPQTEAENNYHLGYDINIEAFSEDERLEIWIQTRDDYENSYYYSGDILVFDRGHSASPIRQAYPRTNTIVYSKTPRILIELNNDNFEQEVLVKWGNTTYSNKDNPEYFSSEPKATSYSIINGESVANPHNVVFRPPVSYTTKHNSKVPYSIKINNTCSTSEETYYTYYYRNFWQDFSDTKFIPLKSNHLNYFKEAINDVRDAYGLETVTFNRQIQKNMILDNEDYNSVDAAIKDVNEKINNADPTDNLDDNRTYIVMDNYSLVGYDSETDTDFVEWQQLLDLLENM